MSGCYERQTGRSDRRPKAIVCPTGLEVESGDGLHGAEAVGGGGDGAEAAGIGLRIRGGKYRVVGQIVGFKAQSEAAVFAEAEALDDVGVQLVDAIRAQVVEGGQEGAITPVDEEPLPARTQLLPEKLKVPE